MPGTSSTSPTTRDRVFITSSPYNIQVQSAILEFHRTLLTTALYDQVPCKMTMRPRCSPSGVKIIKEIWWPWWCHLNQPIKQLATRKEVGWKLLDIMISFVCVCVCVCVCACAWMRTHTCTYMQNSHYDPGLPGLLWAITYCSRGNRAGLFLPNCKEQTVL